MDYPSPLPSLAQGNVIGRQVFFYDSIDSTNSELKRRAARGDVDGLVIIADTQTAGRGRRGRSFISVGGKGLYLSAAFSPVCTPEQFPALTAWAAVAVCEAVESVCGIRPGIKWPNDLLLQDRKLCGILTERVGNTAIIGIGLNISQTPEDFGAEVSPIAISLAQALETAVDRTVLAGAVLGALEQAFSAFPGQWETMLSHYRQDCLTVGQPVVLLRNGHNEEGFAEGVNEDFSLRVRTANGAENVSSGEVSVRSLSGQK